MRTGGLKQIHVVIIGIVVAILAAVGVFFAVIKPLNEQIAEIDAEKVGYEEKARTKPQAEKKLAAAQ
ncbi:MAG: hypothetical protein KY468_18035, partial [Armatimonadetes bacterium]|nr:hypothetical protein [Armatimonadota bacterium]